MRGAAQSPAEQRLRGEQDRRTKDQPGRQGPECGRRGGEQQDRACDAAEEGDGGELDEVFALSADLPAEPCRTPGVAGPDSDRVGDVGGQSRIPQSQERRERDEASAARHAVEDARPHSGENEQYGMGRTQRCRCHHPRRHGSPAYGTPSCWRTVLPPHGPTSARRPGRADRAGLAYCGRAVTTRVRMEGVLWSD